ncbi:YlbL family protein [Corynebacterium sp. H78]|uniref:YlbL family protein n=1 Tax=Corynebacterium sp. H78 TaxID=3133417 RepID=UPI0030A2F804
MNRRTRTLLVGALPIGVLALIMSSPSATVPFAAEGPGPLFDVLGDLEGKPMIDVSGEGVDTEKPKGSFNMTTVAVHHSVSLPQAIGLWLKEDTTVVPIESVFPPGVSEEEIQEKNDLMFTDSEANATAAALAELGLPTKVSVAMIMKDSAAEGVLKEGDILHRVGEEAVQRPESVKAAVAAMKPGDDVDLIVERVNEQGKSVLEPVTVKLGDNPDNKDLAFLGIGMEAQPDGEVEVAYNVTGVGGPSAGLMLALGVVDKLSPGDLTGGKRIAGTGTIDGAGRVGEIGGITHKIAAAREEGGEYFFVPSANCSEALTADAGDMKLIRVNELSGAVEALKNPDDAPACQKGE